jgi:hypothetical protein
MPDGSVRDEFFARGEAPAKVRFEDGQLGERDVASEVAGHPVTSANYPMVSDAAGVHPDQTQEAYDHSVANGVPTQFTKDGSAVFESAGHRKRYCEAVGLYDRNAGYGDPQRKYAIEIG